jgi:hypothetical protein
LTPEYMFLTKAATVVADDRYWHSNDLGGGNGTFDITYSAPTIVTHIRVWPTVHQASQNVVRTMIYGDGILIAEYGIESRPRQPTVGSFEEWRVEWSELAPAVTLTVPSPAAYTKYTLAFPDAVNDPFVALGRMQLLNVPAGAAVPEGLFLDPPVYAEHTLYPSTDAPLSVQLEADAGATFALARTAVLPNGFALSPEGVISGQTSAAFGDSSTASIRALIAGALGSYASTSALASLDVRQAVLTVTQEELVGRGLQDGDAVAAWGGGLLRQTDPALRPVFVAGSDGGGGSVRFTEGRLLRQELVPLNIGTGGGLTLILRFKINSIPASDGRVFAFQTGVSSTSSTSRMIVQNNNGNIWVYCGNPGMEISPVVIGEWVTLAVTYDATTSVTTVYRDGLEQGTATLGNLGDSTFEWMALGSSSSNSAGSDVEI